MTCFDSFYEHTEQRRASASRQRRRFQSSLEKKRMHADSQHNQSAHPSHRAIREHADSNGVGRIQRYVAVDTNSCRYGGARGGAAGDVRDVAWDGARGGAAGGRIDAVLSDVSDTFGHRKRGFRPTTPCQRPPGHALGIFLTARASARLRARAPARRSSANPPPFVRLQRVF